MVMKPAKVRILMIEFDYNGYDKDNKTLTTSLTIMVVIMVFIAVANG